MPLSIISTGGGFSGVAFVFFAALMPALAGRPADVPVAPVPPQLATAKTVFISNAGADRYAMQYFPADAAYSQMYSDMKGWNKYQVVSSPSDADLVFEVRLTAPFGIEYHTGFGMNKPDSLPHVQLTILDARTHFILWTITEPVENAYRKSTFRKNLNEAMARLFRSFEDAVVVAGAAEAVQ